MEVSILFQNVMICFGCSKCQVRNSRKGEGLILTRSGLEAAQDTVSMVHSPRQFGNKQKPIQRRETDKSKIKGQEMENLVGGAGWRGREVGRDGWGLWRGLREGHGPRPVRS